MDDRSSTSKPTTSSPSQSTTPDIKSPTTRPTYSSKLSDQKSRVSEVASSNTTARQPPIQQRAWTSNKNPITGRSQTPHNNFNSQNKQSVTASLREGQRVRITLASGAEFEGIYSNGPELTSCRLGMVSQKKLPNSQDISNGAGRREQATMSFQRKEIVEARVVPGNGKSDGKVTNGNRSGFKTDSTISNARFGGERELKRWVPDSNDDADLSLEQHGGGEKWDQFATNQKLFGISTDYDETIYTTAIDKSHPDYHKRLGYADRKAREIERSAAATSHVAEERVMDFVGGDDHRDEEEKYSGVRRQDFPPLASRENKYTPPARRAPTSHSTVKGAPVDPAIISSQLKVAPSAKQPTTKADEPKASVPATKTPEVASAANQDVKTKDTKENETKVDKPNVKAAEIKPIPAAAAVASRTATPKEEVPPILANRGVEQQVLTSFKTFAGRERAADEKRLKNKAAKDKEIKLHELRAFSQSFKLSTPVPTDLIGIIAKDPEKQKAIQEKALHNAEEINRKKAEAAQKEKEAAAATSHTRTTAEQPAVPAATPAVDSRTTSRPSAPQHTNSQSGLPNRHQGPRAGYNNYQQYNRGGRGAPHLAQQGQATGNLAQRLRSNIDQQKGPHPHMGQHGGVQDMRLPPTGPANNVDPSYGRRVSGLQPPFLGGKLNPNSHEFRPNAFAQPFMPAGPSQGSSPRSSVNNIVEPTIHPTPVPGQLTRRKKKQVDIMKCFILGHIETFQAPQGRSWDHNEGLRPAYDTAPLWRQPVEEPEKPDSPINLTYKEFFEKLPLSGAAVATPNPSHAMPQLPPHQHQLPFHLQHGAQNMAPRQSPHLPPMQMHAPQHGHGPHPPFNGGDEHRMMHSNSAQSFASPRMGQVPMAYAPAMGTPGQMQYSQPVMQPYMNPGAPQMGQFRSFSNNPQFIPQQPHHMGSPMMVQQQFMPGPAGMIAGPQVPMYPGHPQFMPTNTVPPQPMAGSNGFPSPSRPAAPMMVHQGSHQGQPAVYGVAGMPYQQPGYPPQQPQGGKFSGQRPQ